MAGDLCVERGLFHFTVRETGDIDVVCTWCRNVTIIKTGLDLDHLVQRLDDWLCEGMHLQQVLPQLTDNERELLISGTCPLCWERMFPPESETEQEDADPA